jgi:hypothetical protein
MTDTAVFVTSSRPQLREVNTTYHITFYDILVFFLVHSVQGLLQVLDNAEPKAIVNVHTYLWRTHVIAATQICVLYSVEWKDEVTVEEQSPSLFGDL